MVIRCNEISNVTTGAKMNCWRGVVELSCLVFPKAVISLRDLRSFSNADFRDKYVNKYKRFYHFRKNRT